MLPYQQRVVDEKNELDEKLSKLTDFIAVNHLFKSLSEQEQFLLVLQFEVMVEYSEILGSRIELFK